MTQYHAGGTDQHLLPTQQTSKRCMQILWTIIHHSSSVFNSGA